MTSGSARRRYMLVSFLTWLPPGLMMPAMVLLMLERGLGIAEAGLVVAAYSLVIIVLELPTGGLADVLGRKVVLSCSAAFNVLGLGLAAFADSLWLFLVSFAFKGVARALSSGPAEAWYVDTVHALEGPGADLKPGLSRGYTMESAALLGGTLVGGFVPLVVPERIIMPLAVPTLMGSAAAVVLLVVVLFAMPEPPHPKASLGEVLRGVPATIGSGLALAARDGVLRRLMLAGVAFGAALIAVELLTPGRLAELTGAAESGATVYAVVAAVGFAGSALGSAIAPWAARVARTSPGGAAAGTVLSALSLAALAATTGLDGVVGVVAAGGAYAVMFTGLSVNGLLRAEMAHHRVTSAQRATTSSMASLSLHAGGGLANLGLATLAAQAGTATAWGLTALLVLASALLYVRMPGRPLEPVVLAREEEGVRPA